MQVEFILVGVGILLFAAPYLGKLGGSLKGVSVPTPSKVRTPDEVPADSNLRCLVGVIGSMKGDSEEREYLISKVLPRMVRESVDE